MRDAVIHNCINARSDRATFSGKIGSRDVVFKLFYGDEVAQTVSDTEIELKYQWERMSAGKYRVPEPIWHIPEKGLSIMSSVPGRRLDTLFNESDAVERAQLISYSGAWLKTYAEDRQRNTDFSAQFWVKMARRLLTNHIVEQDRDRASQLVKWMFSRAKSLNGMEIIQARSHGDYCELNLLYDDEVMYGVDLHNNSWLPLAKDVARFLVFLNCRHPVETDQQTFGLPSKDVTSFLSAFEFLDERDPLFVFFIASELSRRLVEHIGHEEYQPNTRILVDGFLSGASKGLY